MYIYILQVPTFCWPRWRRERPSRMDSSIWQRILYRTISRNSQLKIFLVSFIAC